jgi:hypothetical protein
LSFQKEPNKVAADETAASGDEDLRHGHPFT